MNGARIREKSAEGVFALCASVSVLAVALISVFIFLRGVPAMVQIGLFNFLFGMEWQPTADIYGILPMIVASLLAGVLSVALGTAIGLMTAIFMAELAPEWMNRILRPAIDLLAGIPSVVYGFFGLTVLVPFISERLGGPGNSLLAVVLILGVMVLPTIVSICQDAIRAVPKEYTEGSLALGASKIQTIFKVVVPAAKSGILAGVVLGAGRAIGETMAVLLVAGNRPRMPKSLLSPVRTLTGNVAMEMSYASGLHQDALFATGVVLFVFIMILNFAVRALTRKAGERA